MPEILDRTLGYFREEQIALVQTPQVFTNVSKSDPLGSQARLFYGPIQQGKDGWNAAFFCGSNAVIRRDALMQLGVSQYVRDVEIGVYRALRTADTVLGKALSEVSSEERHRLGPALQQVTDGIAQARLELQRGDALAEVTYRFQRSAETTARRLVEQDIQVLSEDLKAVEQLSEAAGRGTGGLAVVDDRALQALAQRDWSPLGAIESVRALVRAIDLDRAEEAQAVMPMATISVTEDMATCMRLHAMGWASAYHDETLALGLAPEDLATMLTQRLRWAQGTMQVMFRENPLLKRGLSIPQRLMYWATIWSYLSGFAAVVYLAAPVIFLLFGIVPVNAFSGAFFLRLIPYLAINQLMFFIVSRGTKTWRGQQYSLALFPVWIKAVTSAFSNVYRGRSLAFAVTPKLRQDRDGPPWHLVKYQLIAIGVLVIAMAVGLLRLVTGHAATVPTIVNLVWGAFDLLLLSVVIPAARYRGYEPLEEDQT